MSPLTDTASCYLIVLDLAVSRSPCPKGLRIRTHTRLMVWLHQVYLAWHVLGRISSTRPTVGLLPRGSSLAFGSASASSASVATCARLAKLAASTCARLAKLERQVSTVCRRVVGAQRPPTSGEILLRNTPFEVQKVLLASECTQLLAPTRAICWISPGARSVAVP